MPCFMSVSKHFESCHEYLKRVSQNKQNHLSVSSNYFTNVINFVRGIIKLSLLKVFVFIMDSCDHSAIDYNNC